MACSFFGALSQHSIAGGAGARPDHPIRRHLIVASDYLMPVQISAHTSNRAMFGGLKNFLKGMLPERTSMKRVVSSRD